MNIPAQLQKAQTKQNKKSTPSQLTKKKRSSNPTTSVSSGILQNSVFLSESNAIA